MTDNILALAFLLFGVGGIIIARFYLSVAAAFKREYGEAIVAFYDAATPIMKDEDTPDSMRETIMIMSDLIDDKDSSKALFKIVRARKANLNKTMPFHIKEATEFFAKRPELERSFFELIKQWFIAITALRPIYGSYVRVATFSHYERINRLTEMTVGKADHGRDHDCPNKLDDGVAGAAY